MSYKDAKIPSNLAIYVRRLITEQKYLTKVTLQIRRSYKYLVATYVLVIDNRTKISYKDVKTPLIWPTAYEIKKSYQHFNKTSNLIFGGIWTIKKLEL